MTRRHAVALLALCCALGAGWSAAGSATGAAGAPAPSNPCAAGAATATVVANATRLGFVDVHLFGAQGAAVSFFECVDGRAAPLGERTAPAGELTSFYGATTWRCVRLVRTFAATATLPDGTYAHGSSTVRTRSCAHRFALSVPRRARLGGLARIRIADRWNIGGARPKLCVTPPHGRASCRTVTFTDAGPRTRTIRTTRRGRWAVALRVPGHSTRSSIAVGVAATARRPKLPTLLAAGDSTMDRISSFLSDEVGDGVNFVSQVEPGIGMSKGDEWQPLAVSQVARLKPSTTVVSIGANEGWPMRVGGEEVGCCEDPRWVDEYARRVRRAMQTYGRGVFWLTMVAPRDAARVPIFAAVNTAILRAAQGLSYVHVVRLDELFTPNGYQEVMRFGGRDVRVRDPDGIHLSVAGAQIAAREVIRQMRAAGVKV